MELKTKALYFLSMLTLPLFGCQKEPLPENDGYNHNSDTTINIQPNHPILPPTNEPGMDSIFTDTLRFSWEHNNWFPHYDYVKSFTDGGAYVVIVPDTTEQSIKGSCERSVGQWSYIYNYFMNCVAENPGHVKLGGCIYVPQIGDNLSDNVMGMYRTIADLFKELGITVKVKNTTGKTKKTKDTPNEQMPRNMAQSMVQSNTSHEITWGFDHNWIPCEKHVAKRTEQYGGTHLVPDSTLWSQLQQQQFSKEDWDYIASQFIKYQTEYGTTFKGPLYPFTNRMSPGAKTIFENLGFHVIEMVETPGAKNQNAMPWNQATQMLQNKSR